MYNKGNLVGGRNANAYNVIRGFRQIFGLVDVRLEQNPTDTEIQYLIDLVETEKVFEKHWAEISMPLIELLEDSSIARKIEIRTVFKRLSAPGLDESVTAVLFDDDVFRVERQIKLLATQKLAIGQILALSHSDRLCDSGRELNHPLVVDYINQHNRFPYAFEMHDALMLRNFGRVARRINGHGNNDYLIHELLIEMPTVVMGRVATFASTPQLYEALKVRRLFREFWRDFDANGDQFWFCQDTIGIGKRPDQLARPGRFEDPLDIVQAMVQLVRELYQLNGGAWNIT